MASRLRRSRSSRSPRHLRSRGARCRRRRPRRRAGAAQDSDEQPPMLDPGRPARLGRSDHRERSRDDRRISIQAIPDGISLREGRQAQCRACTSITRRRRCRSHTNPVAPAHARRRATHRTTSTTHNSAISISTGRGARRLSGSVVDHRARGLPALLFELPGNGRTGFSRDILFTSEEAVDWVNRVRHIPGLRSAVKAGTARRSGVVVAHDPKTGASTPDLGHGSPQPREQPGARRIQEAGPALPATTRSLNNPSPVTDVHVPRRERRRRLERLGRPVGVRIGWPGNRRVRGLRPRPIRRATSPGISSRCLSSSRPASTRTGAI